MAERRSAALMILFLVASCGAGKGGGASTPESSRNDPGWQKLGVSGRSRDLRECADARLGTGDFRYEGFTPNMGFAKWCNGPCEKSAVAGAALTVSPASATWDSWSNAGTRRVTVSIGRAQDVARIQDPEWPYGIELGRCVLFAGGVETVWLDNPLFDVQRVLASPDGVVSEWDECYQPLLALALEKLEKGELGYVEESGCEVWTVPIPVESRPGVARQFREHCDRMRAWLVAHREGIHRLFSTPFELHRCRIAWAEVDTPMPVEDPR